MTGCITEMNATQRRHVKTLLINIRMHHIPLSMSNVLFWIVKRIQKNIFDVISGKLCIVVFIKNVYTKHSKKCFVGFPNTSKRVKKHSAAPRFFNPLLSVWNPNETLFLAFDILFNCCKAHQGRSSLEPKNLPVYESDFWIVVSNFKPPQRQWWS